MKRIVFILLFISNSILSFSQAWLPCGTGTIGYVLTMAADTAHNRLFVGGSFSQMDTLHVNNCAIWDGNHWSKFIHDGTQQGMNNEVGRMLVWNNNLYYSKMQTGSSGFYKVDLTTMTGKSGDTDHLKPV